jgi:hypothetical protein
MYDLRASTGQACPECGVALWRDGQARSPIPWVNRRLFMWTGALAATAWRVEFRFKAFCMATAQPVSMREARQFRTLVVMLVWLILAGLWGVLVWGFELEAFDIHTYDTVGWVAVIEEALDASDDRETAFNVGVPVGLGILLWLFLFFATGVHTYWMHPKAIPEEMRRRAVALSYYACGPLLALWVPAGLVLAALWLGDKAQDFGGEFIIVFAAQAAWFGAAVSLVLIVAMCLLTAVRMAGRVAHRGALAQIAMAGLLPACWLGLFVLVFGVLPVVGIFVYLVVATL